MPAVTSGGTPNDTYQVQGSITAAGSLGTAKFIYSLDGITNADPSTVTGTVSLPNTGLTLTFATGSYPAGGTFSFNTFAAYPNATDITNAVLAYTGSAASPVTNVPPLIGIAFTTAKSAVSGSAIFSAVDGALTTLRKTFKKPCAVVAPTGGANGATAATISAFASSVSTLGNSIHVDAERARCQVASPFAGYAFPYVPFSYAIMDTASGQKISTNPAWTAPGPLSRFSSPTYDEFIQGEVYQDAKIGAPRSFPNTPGVYLNQALLLSPANSGYTYLQWGRVINLVEQIVNNGMFGFLNSHVRTVLAGNNAGAIDPRDAKSIENIINGQLQAAVMQTTNDQGQVGQASAVQFTIDQTFTGVLSQGVIQSSCSVVPFANVSNVTVNLFFTNAINQ